MTVLLLAAALGQERSVRSREASDIAELTRLESVWNQAYIRGDADIVDQLCSDDMIATMTNMQVLTKTASIQILRSGRVKFKLYETSDIRIRVYDNAAVVTGRLQRVREAQGQEAVDNWRFTKVYIRRDSKWQVVAWHASTDIQ